MIANIQNYWSSLYDPAQLSILQHSRAKRLRLRFDMKSPGFFLTLPPRTKETTIINFLETSKRWIEKNLITFEPSQHPLLLEEISLLSTPYKIKYTLKNKELLWVNDDSLLIWGPQESWNKLLQEWVKKRAYDFFSEHSKIFTQKLNLSHEKVIVRDSKSRWGSCSSTGVLSFSWRLALAPNDVALYVCAHEVAHLKEMNHSDQFWHLVENLFPNYKECRQWLKKNGHTLFHLK